MTCTVLYFLIIPAGAYYLIDSWEALCKGVEEGCFIADILCIKTSLSVCVCWLLSAQKYDCGSNKHLFLGWALTFRMGACDGGATMLVHISVLF